MIDGDETLVSATTRKDRTMKIVKSVAVEPCADFVKCPEIYELEDGSMLVRGWRMDAHTAAQLTDMPGHEDAVIVPASLLALLRK